MTRMTESKSRQRLISACVFVAALLVTAAGWYYANRSLEIHAAQRFEAEISGLKSQIQNRLATYEQVLRGVAGLFKSSEQVTRTEMRIHVASLQLEEHFPGIQGVGYSQWLGDRGQLANHEAQMRAEGHADYRVRPAGKRQEYSPVVYLEPFDERNRQAFGYDMFSQSVRRRAMQRARDTGRAALSGKVELVQEITDDKQAGFLLYLPLYATTDIPQTISARRAALTGFVYSAFRATDLMRGILNKQFSRVSFRVYDGVSEQQHNLLYDGDKEVHATTDAAKPKLTVATTINSAGQDWTVRFTTNPAFDSLEDSALPIGLLVAGFLLSTLLSIIAWMLLTARRSVASRTAELWQQEALNSQLLEDLAEAVVACDANGKITLFNKKAREWFGVDLRMLAGEDWTSEFDLYDEDGTTHLSYARTPLFRVLDGERVNDVGMSIVAHGGQARHVLASGAPLINSDGIKTGAMVTMRDLTGRRQDADEIGRQRQFLREVIDHNPNCIFARNRAGQYVLANQATAEMYGVTADELIGRTDAEFNNDAAQVAGLMHEDKQILETGEELIVEKKLTDSKGKLRWLHIIKRPLQASSGMDLIVLGIATEISEQKTVEEGITALNVELEERVQQRTDTLERLNDQLVRSRDDADKANRAKSSFLAAMSHEIRTPMNGVIGMVEILLAQQLKHDQLDLVQTIRESAFSLLRIIDDILDFSKIEAGGLNLEHAPLSISSLVESIVSALVPVACKKDVDIDMFIDPEIHDWVYSDQTRLRQILTNLIGNAVKFSSELEDRRGRVSVRVVAESTRPFSLRFDIRDNGIGIETDALDSIFCSFVQAEASTTRRFGGTGLGLAISKRLVELMDGAIQVDSSLSHGSTFTVSLPFEMSEPYKPEPYADLSRVNCILIPDQLINAEDVLAYLHHAGATACLAADMATAMQTAQSLTEPVVVLNAQAACYSETQSPELRGNGKIRHIQLIRAQTSQVMSHVDDCIVASSLALRRRSLLTAVAVAAGEILPEIQDDLSAEQPNETSEAPSVEQARATGNLILIAEDDEINLKVIGRQLKLLGYAAEFARDGKQALTMWEQNTYGMLLTDLHMPELDGYALTRSIRDQETAEKRLPIVALTANALMGEAKKANFAGIDEYLTKPLELQHLKLALEKYLSPANESMHSGTSDATVESAADKPFDLQVLASLVGDEDDVIVEFLQDYLASAAVIGAQLIDASKADDWPTVAQLAHRLKSSSRSMGAIPLGDLCDRLEGACEELVIDRIAEEMTEFENSLMVVRREILNALQQLEGHTDRRAS